ncbi:MAG TPA: class IV adenylate cyclase [Solirubrobacterales bacterium]
MGGERRNLELKARDSDPARSLRVCGELGAEDQGVLLQQDTYFNVLQGRLKLRQEEGASAHLIAYERPDAAAQKVSRYRIVEVEDAASLKEALAGALGVAAVVKKSRRLFCFEGVRIHLDSVEGVGDFIEFEGVAGSDEEDLRRFETSLYDLRRSFGIEDADLIGESYGDLVAKNLHSACNT